MQYCKDPNCKCHTAKSCIYCKYFDFDTYIRTDRQDLACMSFGYMTTSNACDSKFICFRQFQENDINRHQRDITLLQLKLANKKQLIDELEEEVESLLAKMDEMIKEG